MEAGVVEPSPRGIVFCPPRQKPPFIKASGNPGETYMVGQNPGWTTALEDPLMQREPVEGLV